MVRPVPTSSTSAVPAASRRTTSSAPGAQGSGTKKAESRSSGRRPAVPGGALPGGQHQRVGAVHLTVVAGDQHARVVAAHARRARPQVAQPSGTSPSNAQERVSSR